MQGNTKSRIEGRSFEELTKLILAFRDQREWKKFHTPKNLAESLVLEAAEVLEHFQWKTDEEVSEHLRKNSTNFSHELADVLNYLLLLADATGVDLEKAVRDKLKVSEKKYPKAKASGNALKYTELRKL